MQIETGLHLTYCSNIHPGESWADTFRALDKYIPRISTGEKFGIGLRLSGQAAEELAGSAERIKEFKAWLDKHNCYVFTMNGFPYGQFHNTVVKDAVHRPDWLTRERVNYTCNLAQILALIMGDLDEGGISTSPVSYRFWHDDYDNALRESLPYFLEVVRYLHEVHEKSGKIIHLDIEPEPDGLLENSEEFIRFYNEFLLPAARENLPPYGITNPDEIVLRHIQLCYDVCHFSVEFEEGALQRIKNAGIPVGKIQISAALKMTDPDAAAYQLLEAFNESTYLHQAVGIKDGVLHKYPDLPDLLREKPSLDEVRCHFHVPIFTQEFSGLQSTQSDIAELLKLLKEDRFTNHLEVETYTWQVLPEYLSMELDEAIQRELSWVIEQWKEL